VPTGNEVGASLVTDAIPQLSDETGNPNETPVAKQDAKLAFTVTLEGAVTAGAVLSITVTTAEQVETFPFTSVTVRIMLLAPTSEQLKFVCDKTMVSIPQLSVEPLSICVELIIAFPVASRFTEIF
jgi:hypothetical protein